MAQLDVGYTSLDQAPVREAPEPFAEKGCIMQLIEADIVDTKDGRGKRLTYKAEALQGAHKGRKVFGGINIINPNPDAQKIGQAELAELVAAVKLQSIPKDTAELLYRPFSADVAIVPPSTDKSGKTYDAKSEIKRYKLADGTAVREGKAASGGNGDNRPPAEQSATAAPSGKRPWE